MTKPLHKSFGVVEFKVINEDLGIAEMFVNVFNNVDMANERTIPGAFAKSLQRKLPKGVWSHDWTLPVAKTLEAIEMLPGDERLPESIRSLGGLYIKGQFNLDTQRGREAFSDIKFGTIDEFSIGYQVVRDRKDKTGVRDLLEMDLYEWSPVLVGCNPMTLPLSAKSICGSKSLSLAARDRAWDADAAKKSMLGDSDKPTDDYKKGHMVCDGDADLLGSYKLPYACVIDGKLTAVPKGIEAAAGALDGSRGGVELSDEDEKGAKALAEAYYKKMAEEFDDDSIVAPWNNDEGKGGPPAQFKGQYLGRWVEYDMTAGGLYAALWALCDVLYVCFCGEYGYDDTEDDYILIQMTPADAEKAAQAAIDEFSSLAKRMVCALINSDMSEDQKAAAGAAFQAFGAGNGQLEKVLNETLPAGRSFKKQIALAITAAHLCAERAKAIQILRKGEKSGRVLSQNNRDRLESIHEQMSAGVMELRKMLDDTNADTVTEEEDAMKSHAPALADLRKNLLRHDNTRRSLQAVGAGAK